MYTLQLRSDEYRLIRLTLMDGGHQAHVFTSVMYPEPSCGAGRQDGGDCLPLFGCDLMQFGPPSNRRMLCVIDLQPIHEMMNHYHHHNQKQQQSAPSFDYEGLLQPIRDQYPSLQQGMTKKFYDADRFSKQMLLGRATTVSTPTSPNHQHTEKTLDACDTSGNDDVAVLLNDLFPAFQGYLNVHLDMVQRQKQQQIRSSENPSETAAAAILQRQRLYDEYAASHDPAHAMFSKHFGKEWADEYIHDVLFPLSRR